MSQQISSAYACACSCILYTALNINYAIIINFFFLFCVYEWSWLCAYRVRYDWILWLTTYWAMFGWNYVELFLEEWSARISRSAFAVLLHQPVFNVSVRYLHVVFFLFAAGKNIEAMWTFFLNHFPHWIVEGAVEWWEQLQVCVCLAYFVFNPSSSR